MSPRWGFILIIHTMGKLFRQLKQQLRNLSRNMVYSFVDDENYEVIYWKSERTEKFELETLNFKPVKMPTS